MRLITIIVSLICFSLVACSSVNTTSAGPLISKPEFRGRVVDAETKEPIEGAVVVVMYWKSPVISGPAGGSSSIVKVKETLTDAKGEFYFPKYSRMLSPLSDDGGVEFIIYKPGYGNFPNRQISPPDVVSQESFFSKKIGERGEAQINGTINPYFFGIVELPKFNKRKDRIRTIPSPPGLLRSKELPILYKAINEERKRFGLGEVK